MNLAPETNTIEAQRNTELLLLDYLRSTNPHIYALWCNHPDYNRPDDDSCSTSTSPTRGDAPSSPAVKKALEAPSHYQEAQFHRAAHVNYACTYIQDLPASLHSMYPARPWVVYWCLQAADLLGVVQSDLLARTPAADITAFLYSCLSHDTACEAQLGTAIAEVSRKHHSTHGADQSHEVDAEHCDENAENFADAAARPVIGFAGGPVHQWPHLAASYAACCALAILSVYDNGASLRRLPRAAIKRWLLALRNDDGSFRVHEGGESDIRASYCAAVITSLLCLDDPSTFELTRCRAFDDAVGAASGVPCEYVEDVQYEPVLTRQTAKFVASCQAHEGGFTCSSTASEAHGAYTQCGLAALLLMKQPRLVYLPSLRRWLAARQLNTEGGFNGRTNKLVDSCYSHWVGASHVLLRTEEAYTKLFIRSPPVSEDGAETADADVSSTCLLAKEVMLLDHAQLLNAKLLHTTENAAWDRAEADHLKRVDLVDQFLSADDSCWREASAKQAALSALYDDILKAHDARTSSAETGEGKDSLDASVGAFHKRQTFLYADVGDCYFNQRKLQDYVLRCCQDAEVGGLMDKPGTAHDAYHTCYALSGISAAQNLQYLRHAAASSAQETSASSDYLARAFARSYLPNRHSALSYGVVLRAPDPSPAAEMSVLRTTSPIFNIHQSAVLAALRVWGLKSFL
ncbi:farnesyltransferase beta subunit [Leptomonas seymouri]|uniref:Farnesyltransferase beta subunit n=1 Tax=Leptomonas seymouri TaxID=5684 RepID=A0A0N1IA19_LEPSE|nr:farnesyltransferase beta subunit [Leptomonas seymouri]|eukprot:KPI89043.1 farnesyltransferase beta subunit [Leptomonas seymouri]